MPNPALVARTHALRLIEDAADADHITTAVMDCAAKQRARLAAQVIINVLMPATKRAHRGLDTVSPRHFAQLLLMRLTNRVTDGGLRMIADLMIDQGDWPWAVMSRMPQPTVWDVVCDLAVEDPDGHATALVNANGSPTAKRHVDALLGLALRKAPLLDPVELRAALNLEPLPAAPTVSTAERALDRMLFVTHSEALIDSVAMMHEVP